MDRRASLITSIGINQICRYIFVSGFLTNFISAPVISAFTSAVSINVMTSQVKGLLGLKKVILNPLSFGLYIF